jgi:stage II sporulation protein P
MRFHSSNSSNKLIQVFIFLALGSFFFVLFVGLSGVFQMKYAKSPVSSMKGLTAALPTPFFTDMIGMEMPLMRQEERSSTFSQTNVAHFLFRFVTGINLQDPRSLLAGAVPGMSYGDAILLNKGLATDPTVYPIDSPPSVSYLQPAPEDSLPVFHDLVIDGEFVINDSSSTRSSNQQNQLNQGNQQNQTGQEDNNGQQEPKLTTGGKKKVFIYHSHNRESWLPELQHKGVKSANEAYDDEKNITLLGKRLAARLEELGIGAVSSEKDYPTEVPNYNWNFSYKYSLDTVREAMAQHETLEYFFDIHRDSQNRDLTTTTINGKTYAQVYFIVGNKNKNWKKNKDLAEKINKELDAKYPGLSRGVWAKSEGHGEYNQSVSPNSILIEVGGPYNTLLESNRTIDILAGVISDIFWEAERVNVPAPQNENPI